MSVPKYTKREFFSISGGALVTALGVHIAGRFEGDIVDDSEHAEAISKLKNPRDRINYAKELFDTNPSFRAGKGTWRELANTPVSAAPDMSRHEYATDFFQRTEGVDLSGAEVIPEAVRLNLSKIVPGLIAQESKYDNGAVSSANARTMWQIIPEFYNSKIKDGENLMDMTVSTRIAFQKFEDIYKKFQTGIKWRNIDVPGLTFDSFQEHFNLSDQQWENFLTMAMVNAYNAGERRILEILNWFIDNHSPQALAHTHEPTELDLFAVMTDRARQSGKFRRYGPHANNYVYYCLGGVESLSGEPALEFSNIDYSQPSTGGIVGWANRRVFDTVAPVTAGVAAGTAIHKGAVEKTAKMVVDRIKSDDRPKKESGAEKTKKLGALRSAVSQIARKTMATITPSKPSLAKLREKLFDKGVDSEELKSPRRRKLLLAAVLGTGAAVTGTALVYRKEIGDLIGEAFESEDLEGLYSLEEVDEEVARLKERGIRLHSSGKKFFEDGRVDAAGRTAFVGMRKDVWATTEQLLEDLDLLDKGEKQIIITGLAEGAGHSSRTHGHANGYSVDFRTSSANKISNALIEDTSVLNSTTRQLSPDHRLIESGLVVGDKIFRYRSKYFLFGVQHEGRLFVCYFDAESTHRHMEMIPWDDYNVDSRADFQRLARLNNNMASIWREEVKDHIRENL